jgi:UDP-N-acetyl-D-glucosamine dehydrogenase
VVGGTTVTCTSLASAFYQCAIERVVTVGSTQAAEMVKLLENTFRAVNIGLVNEIAMMPGPGLGGHCIPIDPFYLPRRTRRASRRHPSPLSPPPARLSGRMFISALPRSVLA